MSISPRPNDAGVYDPQELESIVGAYRMLLEEISDDGLLAAVAHSSLPAREIRRLAAKEILACASIGLREPQELARGALARLAKRDGEAR